MIVTAPNHHLDLVQAIILVCRSCGDSRCHGNVTWPSCDPESLVCAIWNEQASWWMFKKSFLAVHASQWLFLTAMWWLSHSPRAKEARLSYTKYPHTSSMNSRWSAVVIFPPNSLHNQFVFVELSQNWHSYRALIPYITISNSIKCPCEADLLYV